MIIKLLKCFIILVILCKIQANSLINYSQLIKNNYNIPSHHYIEYSFKNEFVESIYKDIQIANVDKIPNKIYKTKLDNIILYL
jgi:hypothetical protein